MVIVFISLSLFLLLLSGAAFVPLENFWLDTVSHFVLQYFIAAAGLLILSLWLGDMRMGAMALVALCLNGAQLLPLSLPSSPVPATGASLKILQANVLRDNRAPEALEKLITEEKPDIILLSEVNTPFARMLEGLRDTYPHQNIITRDKSSFGMAVLSSQPWQNFVVDDHGVPGVPAMRLRLPLGKKAVEIVSIHPHNPLKDFNARNRAFATMAETLAKNPAETRIVAGDFNATPYCATYKDFAARLGLRNAQQGRGPAPLGTYPVFLPTRFLRLPIDHLLVSRDIAVAAQKTGPAIGSDHLPLITTVSIQ